VNILETLGDFGGILVGFLLTIAILSFVIKDNPLYRLAVHVLVGVSAGYAVVIVINEVVLPLFDTLSHSTSLPVRLYWIVPLILAALLLLKLIPRTAWIGNSAMAVIVGVGAAVGLLGAIVGTLLPQILVQYDDALLGIGIGLLAIIALAYFFFTARQSEQGLAKMPNWYPYLGAAGRVVITMTLAGLFAGALNTSIVLLVQRVGFYMESFARIFEVILP
jgi:small-conductance mechanosensitive channel